MAGAFPWLAGVNPLRGQGAGLAANCVLAAIAVEWSLRDGTAHQAGGSDPEPASSLEAFAGQRPWFTVAGPGAVAEAMAAAPEWARGLVVTWEAGDGGPGHAFNVVRHPRLGVVFLDGQAGREAVFPPGQRLVRFAPMTDGIPGPATVPGGPGPGGPVPLGAMTSHLAGTGEPGGTAAGLPGGGGPARAWRDLLGPELTVRDVEDVVGQWQDRMRRLLDPAGPGQPGQPRAAPAGESLLGMLEGAGLPVRDRATGAGGRPGPARRQMSARADPGPGRQPWAGNSSCGWPS